MNIFTPLAVAGLLALLPSSSPKDKGPLSQMIDGIPVPLTVPAYGTLWEGKTSWIVFSQGEGADSKEALVDAAETARALMILLLTTAAIVPDRMDHTGYVYRLKPGAEPVEGMGFNPKGRLVCTPPETDSPTEVVPGQAPWHSTCRLQVDEKLYSLRRVQQHAEDPPSEPETPLTQIRSEMT